MLSARARNFQLPVSKVPVEILLAIFEFARFGNSTSPQLLQSVSHRWLDLVCDRLAAPLWGEITVRAFPELGLLTSIAAFLHAVELCSSGPLDIIFLGSPGVPFSEEARKLWDVVRATSSRWRSLDFRASMGVWTPLGDMPFLRTISIEEHRGRVPVLFTDNATAPLLSSVRLTIWEAVTNSTGDGDAERLLKNLPSDASLKELDLMCAATRPALFPSLARFGSLEALWWRTSLYFGRRPPSPIELPNLRRLYVEGPHSNVLPFLGAPCLETIDVAYGGERDSLDGAFFARYPKLRGLQFFEAPPALFMPNAARQLVEHPTLERVCMAFQPANVSTFLRALSDHYEAQHSLLVESGRGGRIIHPNSQIHLPRRVDFMPVADGRSGITFTAENIAAIDQALTRLMSSMDAFPPNMRPVFTVALPMEVIDSSRAITRYLEKSDRVVFSDRASLNSLFVDGSLD